MYKDKIYIRDDTQRSDQIAEFYKSLSEEHQGTKDFHITMVLIKPLHKVDISSKFANIKIDCHIMTRRAIPNYSLLYYFLYFVVSSICQPFQSL